MNQRILILSASVGAGHLRAAQAVELALRQLAPGATVQNIDVLTMTNAAFRRLYGKFYLDLVQRAPHVLGYFYDLLDKPVSKQRKSDRLRYAIEKANLGPLLRFLAENPWDLIINTHFLPAEIIAHLRSKQKLKTPQFTVTTDFETHRLWVNLPCDRFFTATQEGAMNLVHWGVPEGDIQVTGIPIHPVFAQPKLRELCLKKHDLKGDRPVVLQLAGGFGVGPVEQQLQGVLAVAKPLEVIVVAGRNEALRRRLQSIRAPARHRLTVVGFTDQIDEWMAAADLVISKPGGLTTSETLARGVPMAIMNPIPGQESRNSDYLLENGAAIKINNISTMTYKITNLLDNRKQLRSLQRNAKRLGRARAAFDVARAALDFTGTS